MRWGWLLPCGLIVGVLVVGVNLLLSWHEARPVPALDAQDDRQARPLDHPQDLQRPGEQHKEETKATETELPKITRQESPRPAPKTHAPPPAKPQRPKTDPLRHINEEIANHAFKHPFLRLLPPPVEERQCERVQIGFEFQPHANASQRELVQMGMFSLALSTPNYTRTLPFFPETDAEGLLVRKYVSVFYPDEVNQTYVLDVNWEGLPTGAAQQKPLKGSARFSLATRGMKCKYKASSHCGRFLHYTDLPPAYSFALAHARAPRGDGDALRSCLWPGRTIKARSGETLRFVVRPLPDTEARFRDAARHLDVTALVRGDKTLQQAARVSKKFDERLGGYPLELTVVDPGAYKLLVSVMWYYGDSELNDATQRTPVLAGCHMRRDYIPCNEDKAQIAGAPFRFVVEEDPEERERRLSKARHSNPKCTTADNEGRWLYISFPKGCERPYCTGNRTLVGMNVDWRGYGHPWVWVPFDCYYHYYSAEDIMYCSKKKGISWIHVMGDSQVREFAANLLRLFAGYDFFKFQHLDTILQVNQTKWWEQEKRRRLEFADHPRSDDKDAHLHDFGVVENQRLRLTWDCWYDIIQHWHGNKKRPLDKAVMDHFNLGRYGASKAYKAFGDLVLDKIEASRPDVLVVNMAQAYSAYLTTRQMSRDWLSEFVSYLDEAGSTTPWDGFAPTTLSTEQMTSEPTGFGSPAHAKRATHELNKARVVWYHPGMVQTPVQKSHKYLTTARVMEMSAMGVNATASVLGATHVDGVLPSMPRPDATMDGIHYIAGSRGEYHGTVSATIAHIALNMLFGECDGPPPGQERRG